MASGQRSWFEEPCVDATNRHGIIRGFGGGAGGAMNALIRRVLGSDRSRSDQRKRSLLLGFAFGLGSLGVNLVAMLLANSTTLQSNTLRSASETLALFFAWVTAHKISQGYSHHYDYGFGKLENLASLLVAAVMVISLAIIFATALHRILHPESVRGVGTVIGIVFALLAAALNGWQWRFTRGLAGKERSPVMESEWRLFRAKTVTNLVVMSSLAATLLLRPYSWSRFVDPIGSFVIFAFLLFSAYGVVSMSVFDLLDRTLEESLQLVILRMLARHFDEYEVLHGIRSRRAGNRVFVELFLQFSPEKRMREVQEVIDSVKRDIEGELPGSQVAIVPSCEAVD